MTRLGRITDIERMPGSKRARRIWIDDAPFRVTSAAVISALSIEAGDVVDVDALLQRCEEAERRAARERAFKLLSYHDFSTVQLAERLGDDGYPDVTIGEVVTHLTETGLLDDARFAEAVARSRLRAGYGPRIVRRDLSRAGLPDPLIDAALHTATGDGLGNDVVSAARRILRPRDNVERLAGRLVRRGFDPADAYRAAREALDDPEDVAGDGLLD
jgi:regulatory protein